MAPSNKSQSSDFRRMSDRVRRQPDRFSPSAGISRANAAIAKITRRPAPTNSNSLLSAMSSINESAPMDDSSSSPASTNTSPDAISPDHSSLSDITAPEANISPMIAEDSEVVTNDLDRMSIEPSIAPQVKLDTTSKAPVPSQQSTEVGQAQDISQAQNSLAQEPLAVSSHQNIEVGQAEDTVDQESLFVPLNQNAPAKMRAPVLEADRSNLPLPHGQPPVWAATRSDLCETLPYFRSYQSGYYGKGAIGFSFLLDGSATEGDWLDEDVVITTAGGSRTLAEDGTSKLHKDQEKVPLLTRNIQTQAPVVLIIGCNNRILQFKCPQRYCVLDFFQVSHTWWVKVSGKKACKYRFERTFKEDRSWWAIASSSPPVTTDIKPSEQECPCCSKISLQVYSIGWMCLNPNCQEFWKVYGEDAEENLTYTNAFIIHRNQCPTMARPFELRPRLLADDQHDPYSPISERATKGMVCPDCSRCNPRFKWDRWVCQTKGCNFSHMVSSQKVTPIQVKTQQEPMFTGLPTPLDDWDHSLIEIRSQGIQSLRNYRVQVYEIPECGTVTHFMANQWVCGAKDGPDDMFSKLQDGIAGLERHKMTSNIVPGSRANHFSTNFGVPYKYTVKTDNISFSQAPSTIMRALQRMTWAGEYVGAEAPKFNELLAVGYFRTQSMSYHDDGEKDLGPTIATLSLGSEAEMKIRMKAKHYHGKYGKVLSSNPKMVPGCLNYQDRLRLHQQRAAGLITPEQFKERAFEVEKSTIAEGRRQRKTAPDVINMFLRHGDIVIMDGRRIQEFYEHAVEPRGALRFALTCRYINPSASYIIDDADRLKGNFEPSPEYAYSGDDYLGAFQEADPMSMN